jgi:hypothetical protein
VYLYTLYKFLLTYTESYLTKCLLYNKPIGRQISTFFLHLFARFNGHTRMRGAGGGMINQVFFILKLMLLWEGGRGGGGYLKQKRSLLRKFELEPGR